jgi:hypothetical protein
MTEPIYLDIATEKKCGRTIQILVLLGFNLTNFKELTTGKCIYDAARKRCPVQKKNAWDLVIRTSMWSIWLLRGRKLFDGVEIPVHIVAKQCIEICKHWAHRARK